MDSCRSSPSLPIAHASLSPAANPGSSGSCSSSPAAAARAPHLRRTRRPVQWRAPAAAQRHLGSCSRKRSGGGAPDLSPRGLAAAAPKASSAQASGGAGRVEAESGPHRRSIGELIYLFSAFIFPILLRYVSKRNRPRVGVGHGVGHRHAIRPMCRGDPACHMSLCLSSSYHPFHQWHED